MPSVCCCWKFKPAGSLCKVTEDTCYQLLVNRPSTCSSNTEAVTVDKGPKSRQQHREAQQRDDVTVRWPAVPASLKKPQCNKQDHPAAWFLPVTLLIQYQHIRLRLMKYPVCMTPTTSSLTCCSCHLCHVPY